MQYSTQVSKAIRELRQEIGGAIPINEIRARCKQNGVPEKGINEGLEKLLNDGVISKIDEDTVEFM